MTDSAVVLLIANILVIFAWLGAGLFVGFYLTRSPWRKTPTGRTLMYRAATMLALLTYALTARWLHAIEIVEVTLGLLIYALVAAMEWRMFYILRKAQKEGKANGRERQASSK